MVVAALLIFASVFLGVFALVLSGATAGQSPAARLKSRLGHLAEGEGERLSEPREELLTGQPHAEGGFYRLPLMTWAKPAVERSGLSISPTFFVLWTVAGSLCCSLAVFLLRGNALLALAAALAVAMGALFFLGHRKKRRESRFTEQLPDALTMIARSLRAGHSLTGAVELVAEELPEPAGSLFRLAYEQQRLGMRMADSLATLPDKIDSMDPASW